MYNQYISLTNLLKLTAVTLVFASPAVFASDARENEPANSSSSSSSSSAQIIDRLLLGFEETMKRVASDLLSMATDANLPALEAVNRLTTTGYEWSSKDRSNEAIV